MKLAQFYVPHRGIRTGVLQDDRVLDLTELAPNVRTVNDLLERSRKEGVSMEEIADEILRRGESCIRPQTTEEIADYLYNDLDIAPNSSKPYLLMPIYPPEVWGFGVTYQRSAQMRDEDSGTTIYDHAYSAERPEVFFKATSSRCVGPNGPIGIRCDSTLTATEPELAYVLGKDGQIVGYTCCNDVSAWDIERENPLYLPQSKIFTGCCAIGPVLVTPSEIPDPRDLQIACRIFREGEKVFEDGIHSSRIKRSFEELTEFLCRNNPVPMGTVVSTGTGIMIPNEWAMQEGDRVEIEIERIGVLSNVAKRLKS